MGLLWIFGLMLLIGLVNGISFQNIVWERFWNCMFGFSLAGLFIWIDVKFLQSGLIGFIGIIVAIMSGFELLMTISN